MYDKDFIQAVCELTCTQKDVVKDISSVKYDISHPFEKYYNFSTIKGAIEKFISKEWDDNILSHWANAYSWILSGGFKRSVIEDLNTLEKCLKNIIVWDLDGLSFFNEDPNKNSNDIYETIQLFEDFDHIWQTRNEWKAVYTAGPYAKYNGDQYITLFNKNTKEYMIIFYEHLKNGFEDNYFKFVGSKEFMEFIEQLEEDGYGQLGSSESLEYVKDVFDDPDLDDLD